MTRHDHEDRHLKNSRPFDGRISVDIDGPDSDLVEILNVLVTKRSEKTMIKSPEVFASNGIQNHNVFRTQPEAEHVFPSSGTRLNSS